MADDRDDAQRTEEPTQRRLEQAQEHGDVVKSTEVTTFAVLAGATLAIAIFGGSTSEYFARNFRIFLEQPDQIAVDPSGIMTLFHATLWNFAGLVAPILAVEMGRRTVPGHVRPSFKMIEEACRGAKDAPGAAAATAEG